MSWVTNEKLEEEEWIKWRYQNEINGEGSVKRIECWDDLGIWKECMQESWLWARWDQTLDGYEWELRLVEGQTEGGCGWEEHKHWGMFGMVEG